MNSQTKYVKSDKLQVEHQSGDAIVLTHGYLGTRLRLDNRTHGFLNIFEEARSLQDLAAMGNVEKAMPVLRKLHRAGFIHEEGHRETLSDKVVQRVSTGFFGCPSVIEPGVRSDITFLGAPLDFGNHKGAGTRGGPNALRHRSLDSYRNFRMDEKTGEPVGFFDNDSNLRYLAGTYLADAGDLFVAPSQSPASVYANLGMMWKEIASDGTFPVVLGGDHSLTYPILAAIDREITVVQVDAHTDLAAYYDGAEHHHGNFMTRALRLDHLTEVRQLGVRNITSEPQTNTGGKIAEVRTVREIRSLGIDAILDAWDPNRSYYLTFDIDAIDPSIAPGTTTPVPGGLTFEEAKDLAFALGHRFDFVGFDFVEVNPERDPFGNTELIALEMVLTFLGGQFERRLRVGRPS